MSDQSQSGTNIDAKISHQTVSLPFAWRLVSGLGSAASTILLALLALVYQGLSTEWQALKSTVAEIREEMDRMPPPEEVERLRDHVQNLNDKIIRIEAKFDR